jgi:hypothetical protein
MKPARLFSLLLGVALGFAAGLFYSWTINPVEYVDAAPASLRPAFKEEYLALIAASYDFNSDLQRTRARLADLNIADPASSLSRLAQNRLAAGRPETEVLALAQLAAVLGERPAPLTSPGVERPATATLPPSPTVTTTPTRTRTPAPSPTPGAPYTLRGEAEVCDPDLGEAQLQIVVLDAAGAGIPGVEVQVISDAGTDRFYTGLKPELGPGYADFTMQPGTTYALQLSGAERPLSGLVAPTCAAGDGSTYPGAWLLTFEQPALP